MEKKNLFRQKIFTKTANKKNWEQEKLRLLEDGDLREGDEYMATIYVYVVSKEAGEQARYLCDDRLCKYHTFRT